jgi:hypothetical protein
MTAIVITNWCLLVFGAISLIGWTGSAIAYYRNEFFWYDLFNWTLYIAFTVFALAVMARFILFLATGD